MTSYHRATIIIDDPEPPRRRRLHSAPQPRNAMPRPRPTRHLMIRTHHHAASCPPTLALNPNGLTFEAVTSARSTPTPTATASATKTSPTLPALRRRPVPRDHDLDHIARAGARCKARASRAGIWCQQIRLTVPRDIEAFTNGQIDRFSVSWYYSQLSRATSADQDWPQLRLRQHLASRRYATPPAHEGHSKSSG